MVLSWLNPFSYLKMIWRLRRLSNIALKDKVPHVKIDWTWTIRWTVLCDLDGSQNETKALIIMDITLWWEKVNNKE